VVGFDAVGGERLAQVEGFAGLTTIETLPAVPCAQLWVLERLRGRRPHA
jgi:hypothetical protein